MANHKLLGLVATATLLSSAHMVDHAIRDELPRWPAEDLATFAVVNLVLFGAIGTGIYLYVRGKVGPRFWTLFAFAGVLPGWASHFSPFTDQPVSCILGAYDYGVGGWLAVGVLLALMLVMTMAGVYAASLWRREVRMQRRMEGA